MSDKNTKLKIRNSRYSDFYKRVWLECIRIKSGRTSTYSEIARKIGHPNAARAVGNALARNPFAPDVPCHRVVRKDGSPGGYSVKGGISGKTELLSKEK
jgi:O-6-methylguanine DNA methyltransferase